MPAPQGEMEIYPLHEEQGWWVNPQGHVTPGVKQSGHLARLFSKD